MNDWIKEISPLCWSFFSREVFKNNYWCYYQYSKWLILNRDVISLSFVSFTHEIQIWKEDLASSWEWVISGWVFDFLCVWNWIRTWICTREINQARGFKIRNQKYYVTNNSFHWWRVWHDARLNVYNSVLTRIKSKRKRKTWTRNRSNYSKWLEQFDLWKSLEYDTLKILYSRMLKNWRDCNFEL